MKRHERNYLSVAEFGCCYPMQFLEFLHVFEIEGQKQVLLDNEAIKIIDLLFEKTERLKTEKLNSFLNEDTQNKIKYGSFQTFITTKEFFDLLIIETSNCEDKITKIEIDNYVSDITKDYNYDKLLIFYNDLETYIGTKFMEYICNIEQVDINKRKQAYIDNNVEIPYIFYTDFEGIEKQKLDIEKMFFPFEFLTHYDLQKTLKTRIDKHLESETIQIRNPKHENIFCNNGFELFNHILNDYVKTKRGRLSDIHFYYWSLYDNKPQYIHQRPERFKEWFFENYNEDLGKIKTFKEVNIGDRPILYSNALDWFKLQNQ